MTSPSVVDPSVDVDSFHFNSAAPVVVMIASKSWALRGMKRMVCSALGARSKEVVDCVAKHAG